MKRAAKLVLRAAKGGWRTADGLASDLRALGVRRGGVLLVHSSLSALGFVPGGAQTVIAALLDVLGPEGTLVMPSHTWARAGRGDFTFDLRSTPVCVGAIAEAFRTMPGVSRSLHPTHSVAATGPRAAYFIADHESAGTPCGQGTPYLKLIEERCQILFLGTNLDSNTMFHALETLAEVPYLLRAADEPFTITDAAGVTRVTRFRRHERGPDRRFAETRELLESRSLLRAGKVGSGESLLVECAPMAELVLEVLKKDPDFLADRAGTRRAQAA